MPACSMCDRVLLTGDKVAASQAVASYEQKQTDNADAACPVDNLRVFDDVITTH